MRCFFLNPSIRTKTLEEEVRKFACKANLADEIRCPNWGRNVELSQPVRRKDTQGLLRRGNSPVNCLMQSNGQELCCCPGRWFVNKENEIRCPTGGRNVELSQPVRLKDTQAVMRKGMKGYSPFRIISEVFLI